MLELRSRNDKTPLWIDPAKVAGMWDNVDGVVQLLIEGQLIDVDDPERDVVRRVLDARDSPLEHDWGTVMPGGSGMWKCKRCGKYATGGLHDGGGYYPERGQRKTYCEGVRK